MSQVALKEELSQKCDEAFSKYTEENNSYAISMQYLARIFQQLAHNENDLKVKHALELIGKVCSCVLDLNSKDIFKPYMLVNNPYQRSFIPSDLTKSDFNCLIEILNCVNQPILKARIADILWSYNKPRNILHVRTAIENYILIDFNKFSIDTYHFWHRATSLAKSINQQDYLDRIKNILLQEIDNPTSDWKFHKFQIAEIFLKTELGKDIFENLAEKMLSESKKFSAKSDDFKKVEDYLSIAKKLFDKANDEDKKIECIFLLANAIEQHGDFKSENSHMVSNHFYKLALKTYLEIPNSYRTKYNIERYLDKIKEKITLSGNNIIDEMEAIKITKDISPLQNQSINHVKNKNSLCEALLYFSGVFTHNGYQAILNETKTQISQSVLTHIAPFTAISQDGRAIEKIESLSFDGSNQEEVIFKTAIKNFGAIRMNIAVFGCILPALKQIQEEFIISKDFLIELCRYSSIVPEKRENLVAAALYYGFEWDFATCIHLLAPQVENIVRQLLKKNGITTTTGAEDIEHEIGLSALLEKSEAKEILGDDLWFELQAVFTSSLSANLRNMVAHSLLDDETSNAYYSVYAWWLIFKWVIRSIGEEQ